MNLSLLRFLPRVSTLQIRAAFSFAIATTSVVFAEPPTEVSLPEAAKGAAAIAALGEHLPSVAKAYGLEAQELATLFRLQRSLGVDTKGALIFSCDALPASPKKEVGANIESGPSDALTTTSSLSQLSSGTSVDAFQLHSLPGASRVIYLDFNGHTTTGTYWNNSYGGSIVSQPFDLDGDSTTFSDAERAAIQGIWKRVAEDYAPFSVDVTTQDPGSVRRGRVVISPTNWYYAGAGGTAYVGSYGWTSDTPCFIFTQQLANWEKYIAEAVSHEVGHMLGLYHDGATGSSPTEYYYGQGDWAPIMGVGYYKSVTQFSKGEYAYANNTQDDIAVISGYLPLVSDDHGNSLSAATVLAGPAVANGGTIETRTDTDVFRFDTGDGAISLSVVSPAGEPDLHAMAELIGSTGQVLQTFETASGSIAFNVTLSAGTYYLRISGIGFGDPTVTGYTDYGSLGNYIITGNLVGISGKQAPVARISASTTSGTAALAVSFSGQNSSDVDGTIASYNWDFGNGTTGSGMNASCTYAAAGTFIAVLTVTDNDGMANSASVAISVSAPANLPPTAVASASTTSGTAPLAITFSSEGSSDPDGSIASWKWTFGDGTTSTSASPTKSYSAAGNYTVTLTVTDNAGASASSNVLISVASDPNAAVDIRGFTLTSARSNSGTSAIADVVVKDRAGQPVAGVSVTIQWSGLVSNKTTGKTDAAGRVIVSSGRTKKSGVITGTVFSVTPPAGSSYDSTIDTVTATVQSIKVN